MLQTLVLKNESLMNRLLIVNIIIHNSNNYPHSYNIDRRCSHRGRCIYIIYVVAMRMLYTYSLLHTVDNKDCDFTRNMMCNIVINQCCYYTAHYKDDTPVNTITLPIHSKLIQI